MSTRTVTVRYDANADGFIAGTRQAQTSVEQFARAGTAATKDHAQAWETLGSAATKAGLALDVGVGFAVKRIGDFDQAMSGVSAATKAGTTSLEALRAAAIKAGADTQFSATEAADAIIEMGKAGVSTADILGGGLRGALDLAAAGQLGVADAAQLAATALEQFNLDGRDMSHVADLYAAAAGKAQGSVADMGQAMKYAGTVASSMGISIEETTGTLALFASKGLIGEQAGTTFRSMLMSLTSPSMVAKKTLDQLGVSLYDGSGKFIGMEGAAEQLKAKLGPLDEATRNAALGRIFDNTAMTGAIALYQGGAAAVQEWTKKVDDSGFAADQARRLTDNLWGDIERLGGSLDSAIIQNGDGANAVLRGMAQNLEALVDGFSALPGPVQQGAVVVGVLTAGVLLFGGAAATVIPKAIALNAALAGTGAKGAAMAKGLSSAGSFLAGPWGIALGAATLAVGGWVQAQGNAAQAAQAFTDTLDKQTGALTDATRVHFVDEMLKNFSPEDWQAVTDATGLLSDEFVSAALAGGTAATDFQGKLDALKDQADTGVFGPDMPGKLQALSNVFIAQTRDIDAGKVAWEQHRKAMGDVATQSDATKTSTERLGGAVGDAGDKAGDAKKLFDDLRTSVENYGKVTLDARSATREYLAALGGANASVADATKAGVKQAGMLDLNTEAGRRNQAALDNIAVSALKMATANLENNVSIKDVNASTLAAREQFINMAIKMNMSKTEANKLATQLGLTTENVDTLAGAIKDTPTAHATTFTADTRTAETRIANLVSRINGMPATRTITVQTKMVEIFDSRPANGAFMTYRANGGLDVYGAPVARVPQLVEGGRRQITWAEDPRQRWEAYISGMPGQETRNKQIWREAGLRLGVDPRVLASLKMANGGFLGGSGGGSSTSVDRSRTIQVQATGPNATEIARAIIREEAWRDALTPTVRD